MTAIELLIKIHSFAGAISGASPGDNELIEDIKKDAYQAIALLQEPCEWRWYGKNQWWGTGCGNVKRAFLGGSTIEENGYEYCPFCGKQMKEMR